MSKSKKDKAIRYSKGWAIWLTDQMYEHDIDVKNVVNNHPEQCPTYRTIMRWQKVYPEFREMIQEARESQYFGWVSELHDLKNNDVPVFESKMELDSYKAHVNNRIKILSKLIDQVGPVISSDYNKSSKMEVKADKGALTPTFVIANYSTNQDKDRY